MSQFTEDYTNAYVTFPLIYPLEMRLAVFASINSFYVEWLHRACHFGGSSKLTSFVKSPFLSVPVTFADSGSAHRFSMTSGDTPKINGRELVPQRCRLIADLINKQQTTAELESQKDDQEAG